MIMSLEDGIANKKSTGMRFQDYDSGYKRLWKVIGGYVVNSSRKYLIANDLWNKNLKDKKLEDRHLSKDETSGSKTNISDHWIETAAGRY